MKYTNSSGDSSTVASAGSAIATVLTNGGWVQTSDSGQVSWGSFSWPGSSSTVYQVWHAGDSLQSTTPLFIKLSWTVGGSATNCHFGIGVGTGSDGAGNLTGNNTGYDITGSWGSGNTTAHNSYVSAGSNWFTWMTQCGGSNEAGICAVERSLDSSGNYTADFISLVVVINSNVSPKAWNAPYVGPVAPVFSPAYMLASGTPTVYGSSIVWSPIFPLRGQICNPMTTIGVCRSVEQNDQGTNTASVYGTTHTYMFSSGAQPANNLSSSAAVGIRYE
jgi:hypothetical protein